MKNPFKKEKPTAKKNSDFVVRKICKEAGLNYKQVKMGRLDEVAWAKLTRAAGTIHERLNKLF
jgi:replicative DNA helicase